jgi:hypothetical protein
MNHCNLKVQYQATTQWVEVTAHGFLIAAYQKAKSQGFFRQLEKVLDVKMKTVRYSPADKGATLWASIVVGCEHTVEINDKLGAHEPAAAAALWGWGRFPDQSGVNRWLWAVQPKQVTAWRQMHLDLLCDQTRARARSRWLRLVKGERLLAIDLDQRALVVSGRHYELATPGSFGRKRGPLGYQLSAAFRGRRIGEVLEEYCDSGSTPLAHRIEDLLGSLDRFCARTGIRPHQVLVRGDGQLGTPANIAKLQAHGYHFLFQGLSPARAHALARQVPAETIFWRVENGAERLPRWMADLGWREHASTSGEGPLIRAGTLLLARQEWAPRPKRGGKTTRAKQALEPRPTVIKCDSYLTDWSPEPWPVAAVLPTYDERVTMERYFCDEPYALGAKHVRTHHYEGAALFQLLVATTNNLPRWLQHSTFRRTELEQLGLGRLIHQVMQIPARIHRWGQKWIIEVPQQHHLVKQLLKSWPQLTLAPDLALAPG